jgi:hypothetical protein
MNSTELYCHHHVHFYEASTRVNMSAQTKITTELLFIKYLYTYRYPYLSYLQ